ncbi:serine/threonine-protein kinase pelle isoform X2 [Diachasma alloeum]|uniref:serine/threonine-protein kinase pelle isoform X2 n=1 Tax=Diachasma alloeum TaxID=454923 RepID=UPI00073844FD|nr:serine/threonine-protein kinase pelle isoform X2 [Diachasma alloeum]
MFKNVICERSKINKKGKWMKYPHSTISSLQEEKNPTDHLLDLWGRHNHKISELFGLLSQMQHYRAMLILKPFVDTKYHVLIDRGEGNVKAVLARRKNPQKDSKIEAQNFNQITSQLPVEQKIIRNYKGAKDSIKIINKSEMLCPPQTAPSNSNNLLVVTPGAGSRVSPLPERAGTCSLRGNGFSFGKETTLPQISYQDLSIATGGWNPQLVLGRGGFGTVFRGLWKNTEVAIKKIERKGPETDESYMQQLQQLLRELTILNSRPHENILSLYAFSMGGDAPCLVYQFMANGSLADRLQLRHGTQPLTWLERHEIAKGTARGLQYLHEIGEKPLIHGDIKSANILLDKNFEPRIGDFGLAREGSKEDSIKISKIQGTRPYLPDEFLMNKTLSRKIDTYSYGIVMFELATGLPIYDQSRSDHKYLKDLVNHWFEKNWDLSQLMDRKAGVANKEVYNHLILVGNWCSNGLAKHRPEMAAVFEKLNFNILYQRK